MRKFLLDLLALLCLAAGGGAAVPLTDVSELVEGETYTITWPGSPEAASVKITLSGERTRLGTAGRGAFILPVAEGQASGLQGITFRMPWVDSAAFILKIKEFDALGAEVGLIKQACRFRPQVMAKKTEDGIYLDLHRKVNQRLYVQKSGVITRCLVVSSSINYLFLPPGRHASKPHDHAGVFRVVGKYPSYWSSSYNVSMPWAMKYNSGHFIHATSPRYYPMLGRPASHGCNRLTRHDARELYLITRAGTRVEVIGPGG